jgi:CRP-like cAMP-binding protein
MLAEVERPATARALEATTVMKIPRAILRRVLTEFPDDAANMHAALARSIRLFGEELTEFGARAGGSGR